MKKGKTQRILQQKIVSNGINKCEEKKLGVNGFILF